jgi:cytochrome c-type biogenesis protein CcmH/NrfG
LQDALSVGDATRAIHSRILLSRAICQSRSGQNVVARELFEDLASRDPEMLSARLGVAASRLQSGQYELALAEYRQLLAAPGVAAFLADLLIRRNLEQPQELRDWSEVDSLTRDEQPLIADPVQRALLRADRCIASNDVVDAVTELELAASAFSERPEPARAVERIRNAAVGELRRQLDGTQSELFAAGTGLPKAVIAAAVWLRLQPSVEPDVLVESLSRVFTGASETSAPSERVRWLQFEHAVFRSAAAMELEAGRTSEAAGWQSLAFRRAHELASLDVREALPFVVGLVQQGRGEEARVWLMSLPDTAISAVERANLMTSIVLSANTFDPVINRCLTSVYALIQKEPANHSLWLCYADALCVSGNDTEALQTLDAISSAMRTAGSPWPDNSETSLIQDVALRRAEILAMSNEKPAQAAAGIEQTFAGEGPELRRLEVLARCQFVAGDAAAAVATLTAMDRHQRTLSGDITLAAAMHSLGRTTEFRRLQHQLRWRRHCELLPESDAALLQSVLSIDALSVPSSSSLLTAQ